MEQYGNSWKWFSLCGLCQSYIRRTSGTMIEGVSACTCMLNYSARNITPTQKDQSIPSLKTRRYFQTHKLSWNEQKLGCGSHRAWNEGWLCWQRSAAIYPNWTGPRSLDNISGQFCLDILGLGSFSNCLYIHYNTVTLRIWFTSIVNNEFVDFSGILLRVLAYEKLSSSKYILITYS
jgi:hypothetical protein